MGDEKEAIAIVYTLSRTIQSIGVLETGALESDRVTIRFCLPVFYRNAP